MNNTNEMDFWIFGDARIPKLTILGSMFGSGLIVGILIGRPRKNTTIEPHEDLTTLPKHGLDAAEENNLSDEDRDYIR